MNTAIELQPCKQAPQEEVKASSKNALFSFAGSCFFHLALFAWFLWNPAWHQPVSQGAQTPAPIMVSIVTLPGETLTAPEKLPTEPESGKKEEPPPVTKAAQAERPEEEVIEKKKPSSSPAHTGQARPAKQPAAFATAGVSAGSVTYHDEIRAWLEKHKTYPRRARVSGLEGQVVVSFTFNRSGHILSKQVVKSSGHHILDQAALSAMDAATPLPAIPDSIAQNQITLKVPFGFNLM